jgi:hypothetical protein
MARMTTVAQNRRSGPESRARLLKRVYFLPPRFISSDAVAVLVVPVYDTAKGPPLRRIACAQIE